MNWACSLCTFEGNPHLYLACTMCCHERIIIESSSSSSGRINNINLNEPQSKKIKTNHSITDFLQLVDNNNHNHQRDNNNHNHQRDNTNHNHRDDTNTDVPWLGQIPRKKDNDIKNKQQKKSSNSNMDEDKKTKEWRETLDRLMDEKSKRAANTHKRFDNDDYDDDNNQGGGQSLYHSTRNDIVGTDIHIDVGSLDEGYNKEGPAIAISKPKPIDKNKLIANLGTSSNITNAGVNSTVESKKTTYNYAMTSTSVDTYFEESLVADEMSHVAYDTLLSKVLSISLPSLLMGDDSMLPMEMETNAVPLVFKTESEYISSFEPLLIEETRAGIGSFITTGIGSNERELYKGVYQAKQNDQPVQIYLVKIGLVTSKRSYGNVILDEVKISKVEIENDKENQYSNYNKRDELQKDDLVLILKKKLTITLNNIKDAISCPHYLAVVSEINQRENHMRLVMIKGTSPVPGTVRTCIRLTSLTTYVREWTALHSITNTTLCPLTPYLLKCSPSISTSLLGQINNNLLSKYRALTSITESSSAAVRKINMLAAIENEMRGLRSIKTDYASLKKTDIVNSIKTIIAHNDISTSCKYHHYYYHHYYYHHYHYYYHHHYQ